MARESEQSRFLKELRGLVRSLQLIGDAAEAVGYGARPSEHVRRALAMIDEAKDAITKQIEVLSSDLLRGPLESLDDARSCAELIEFMCDESDRGPCSRLTKQLVRFVERCDPTTCPANLVAVSGQRARNKTTPRV
jgi:hypothetical protein